MTAYAAGKATHIRGITAHGDTLTISLTRAAGDLPARLRAVILLSVPVGTPAVPGGGTRRPSPWQAPTASRPPATDGSSWSGTRTTAATGLVGSSDRLHGRVHGRPTPSRAWSADVPTTSAATVSYDPTGRSHPAACSTAPTAWRAGPAERATPATCQPGSRGSTRSRSTRGGRCSARPHAPRGRVRARSAGARGRLRRAAVRPAHSRRRQRARRQHRLHERPDLATARRLAGTGRGARRRSTSAATPPTSASPRSSARTSPRSGSTCTSTSRSACLNGPEPERLAAADMQLVSHVRPRPGPGAVRRARRSATASRRPDTGRTRACGNRSSALARLRGAARVSRVCQARGGARARRRAGARSTAAASTPEFFSARVGCRVSQGALNFADLGALCLRG